MTELERLHALVKKHRFRLNKEERYAHSYYLLIDKLTEELYTACRIKGKVDELIPPMFIHELRGNSWHVCEYWAKGFKAHEDDVVESDVWLSLEMGIQAIHEFIDTSRITKWYSYYTGHNVNKGGRWTICIWKGEKWNYSYKRSLG